MSPARFRAATGRGGDNVVPLEGVRYAEDSRRAALNLMEDAVQSRETAEKLSEELRRHAAQFEALLNDVPLGLYLIDADFCLRHVSPRTVAAFGDIPDLIGRDFDEVIHRLWPQAYADEIVQRFRHTLASGEPYFNPERVEERLDRGTTEIYEWQLNRISLPEGGYGVVCYFRDISDRVRAEQRILNLLSELQDSDHRKDEFLATLAHELRGPLAPLSNALEIMQRADGNADLLQHARGTIERQLTQLVRLVDDLLDVSRISRNKLELRLGRVDLAPILRQSIEVCRPGAVRARHEIVVSLPTEPITVHADPARLTQVFGNLLHNACKYTEPGGRIELAAAIEGSNVVVSVKDNGLGIRPDMLSRIFDMFTQVDQARERAQGGLGIGLTLVRRLVEMHQGTVQVFSEGLGRGTEFVVRLPLSDAELIEVATLATETAPITGRRILVVDDNRDSALSLAMLLRLDGNDTRMAHNGLDAIAAAEEFRPDVVLLDIGMPKLNGLDACRRIRAQSWGQHMKLVALSGWGTDVDRLKSKEAGFDVHLVKPLDYPVLTALLASLPIP